MVEQLINPEQSYPYFQFNYQILLSENTTRNQFILLHSTYIDVCTRKDSFTRTFSIRLLWLVSSGSAVGIEATAEATRPATIIEEVQQHPGS